ncbi:uncharacterized protein LOC134210676 isoform X2 [Armigeres subalbatus]|uniref:uncharacterized protein LOC134210676 isoform X2 n=1 Tax=Armigeres subalbatus TaxID=124917 RepID=UPI002ED36F62
MARKEDISSCIDTAPNQIEHCDDSSNDNEPSSFRWIVNGSPRPITSPQPTPSLTLTSSTIYFDSPEKLRRYQLLWATKRQLIDRFLESFDADWEIPTAVGLEECVDELEMPRTPPSIVRYEQNNSGSLELFDETLVTKSSNKNNRVTTDIQESSEQKTGKAVISVTSDISAAVSDESQVIIRETVGCIIRTLDSTQELSPVLKSKTSVFSFNDSLENEPLTWHDSSTPDTVLTPTTTTKTTSVTVNSTVENGIASADEGQKNPFKLQPITSCMSFNRRVMHTSTPAQKCLSAKKTVHFDSTVAKHQSSTDLLIKMAVDYARKEFQAMEKTKKKQKKRSKRPPTSNAAVQATPEMVDFCENTPKKWPSLKKRVKQKSVAQTQKNSVSRNTRSRFKANDRYAPIVNLEPTQPPPKETLKSNAIRAVEQSVPRIDLLSQETTKTLQTVKQGDRLKQTTLSPFFNGGIRAKKQVSELRKGLTSSSQREHQMTCYRNNKSITIASSDNQPTLSSSSIETSGSVIIFEDDHICPRIDQLLLSMVNIQSSGSDVVPSSQYVDPDNRRYRRYSILVCEPSSQNVHTVTGDLEEHLQLIERRLTLHIQQTTIPTIESLYYGPTKIYTDDIQDLLMGVQSDEELTLRCANNGSGSDSGMDVTIIPATYNIEKCRCSTIRGSQEPDGFSQEFSPIRFSDTQFE